MHASYPFERGINFRLAGTTFVFRVKNNFNLLLRPYSLAAKFKIPIKSKKGIFWSYAQPHFKQSCNMLVRFIFVYSLFTIEHIFLVQLISQSGFDCAFTFTVNVLIFLSRILIRLQRKNVRKISKKITATVRPNGSKP